MAQEILLQVKNISKTFGGIKALDSVDIDLKTGEVLGLIGENGAGKSTLMKILCGIEIPDVGTGQIIFKNEEIKIINPHHAQQIGIAMIPQELILVPQMSVVENLFLGRESEDRKHLLKKDEMAQKAKNIMKDLQSEYIEPNNIVGHLPKADQQIVAIGRRLLQGGKIFIMDEPTAAFTEKETRNLFSVIKKLCASSCSVIFISHRLEEIIEICDRVNILRDGKMITTLNKDDGINKQMLIRHMVGNEIEEEFPKIEVQHGKEIFRAENLSFYTNQGKLLKDINFTVHEGEVLGITGLVGVGKTEMGQAIFGLRKVVDGKFFMGNEKVQFHSPVDATKAGLGYVSEDRRGEGLILELPSIYNMTISSLKKISKRGMISNKKEKDLSNKVGKQLMMKKEFFDMDVEKLSGGNQQKVVIIRQIVRDAKIIIFDEPTKGIDVAAKSEVSRFISELSKQKKATILISSEPREVLGISDSIFVLTKDGLEGPFSRDSLNYEKLMSIEFGRNDNVEI